MKREALHQNPFLKATERRLNRSIYERHKSPIEHVT